jgi:uncharacterized protein
MATSPVAARPGASFFVPAVRIKKLGPLQAAAEAGDDLPVLDGDVLRVEVTRVNTGVSQYSITLNNWFDSLPADRQDSRLQVTLREQLVNGRPVWPRFKYDSFDYFRFGDRLRIDMRYWPDPPADAGLAARGAHAWVPMVAGPITDMRFTFSAEEGARLTLSGQDDLNPLTDKTQGKTEFNKLSERTIVNRVLSLANYPLNRVAGSPLPWPPFAEDDGNGVSESLQGGQSYLDFLQKLAGRLDFEVFVEFDTLTFPPNQAVAPTFHFEPARSAVPPDKNPGGTFVLRREQHLLDFAPTIKVADQYSDLTVRGRNRDRGQPERIEKLADTKAVKDELHIDPAVDAPLVSGPKVRQHFFADRPNRADAPNQTNLDPARADLLAQAMIRKQARELMTVEATTLGLPRLRPGNHVEVRGYRAPFDGFYYVTKTVHSYGADGLRTRLTARRPGMPVPPYGTR